MNALTGGEHRTVRAIRLTVLDTGKDVEQMPADDRVDFLAPQFERAPVGEQNPLAPIHRINGVANRLQNLGERISAKAVRSSMLRLLPETGNAGSGLEFRSPATCLS